MKKAINRFLVRTTGYKLTKANAPQKPKSKRASKRSAVPIDIAARPAAPQPDAATRERLAAVIGPSLRPVLVMAPSEDGRDALRRALAASPDVYVADLVNISELDVRVGPQSERRLAAGGVGVVDLQHMLWDHLLRDQLARGRGRLVAMVDGRLPMRWKEAKDAWPAAHFVYLLRDPAELWAQAHAAGADEVRVRRLTTVVRAVYGARTHIPGFTIRHEDLVKDPAAQLEALCRHLGVDASAKTVNAMAAAMAKALKPAPETTTAAPLPGVLATAASSWGYE